MVSLGCPKNLTESETVLGILATAGYVVTPALQEAEILVINTCSFIRPAVKESLDAIFNYIRYKKSGSCRYLVVIGCLPERYGRRLKKLIPEVDLWLGADASATILGALDTLITSSGERGEARPYLFENNSPRLLTTPAGTAYLKIAEGCAHGCSYCLIPKLRGGLKSRPSEAICQEAAQLVALGVGEITLVAQDTGSYGRDLYGKPSLDLLIKQLAALKDLRWLRIMYLNPSSLTANLIETIKNEEKVCRYLDLPFQHANAGVLRLMNRPGSLTANLKIVADLRRLLPGIVLRTTLMTGFPGEDKYAFRELQSFVKQAGFERLGVFAYCHEEGTASYRRRETVSFVEKQHRRRQLYDTQKKISRSTNATLIGQDFSVLIEKQLRDDIYLGRSFRDAPDIDPKIIVKGSDLRLGDFTDVKITSAYTFDLAGVAI